MLGDAIVPDEAPQGARDDVPGTGDPVVDSALEELLEAQSGSLAQRIEAGERAHRLLQGRLSDLGQA
ncbi:hypothetical protein N865_01305 [Intrasporangium oryzae NRRL B-24470]|uniref:Uncharacterized protein n=1 Tax=Intrasporangium oryzae NRRL B-24470 TaxID=1386089 RepID=W9G724_9MICO|nr:hypothetical protein [Intrasporangium oryzae]EWS99673.1 hypothetical protein N865_01305 [Intrasporangium oryzae NRRL B-24470]